MDAVKKKGNFWWPDVSTEEGARDAAKGGATGAAIIAVVTAGFALYAAFSSPVMGVITPWSFLDAGLFAVIAFGIWRMSRVAAIAGLALYLIEQAYMWASVGPKNPVMSLLFIMFLIGGVRGTVSFHKHRKAASSAGIAN